jgi:hypothetical protein
MMKSLLLLIALVPATLWATETGEGNAILQHVGFAHRPA